MATPAHDLNTFGTVGRGNNSLTTDMLNLLYDIPLGDTWALTLGGGVGIGSAARARQHQPLSNLRRRQGRASAFQWQAIAGLSVAIAPDVDLFGEYRYR